MSNIFLLYYLFVCSLQISKFYPVLKVFIEILNNSYFDLQIHCPWGMSYSV